MLRRTAAGRLHAGDSSPGGPLHHHPAQLPGPRRRGAHEPRQPDRAGPRALLASDRDAAGEDQGGPDGHGDGLQGAQVRAANRGARRRAAATAAAGPAAAALQGDAAVHAAVRRQRARQDVRRRPRQHGLCGHAVPGYAPGGAAAAVQPGRLHRRPLHGGRRLPARGARHQLLPGLRVPRPRRHQRAVGHRPPRPACAAARGQHECAGVLPEAAGPGRHPARGEPRLPAGGCQPRGGDDGRAGRQAQRARARQRAAAPDAGRRVGRSAAEPRPGCERRHAGRAAGHPGAGAAVAHGRPQSPAGRCGCAG
mmetsp:Transcript_41169/g.105246  ORF Transcript_41169/g.105246 Transcript_41169/m.105246 type:complete len:309 (+) Transcript_41169:424-1350(+)